MNILFVRSYCPSLIKFGAELRASRCVDYLRSKGEVDLLTLSSPQGPQIDREYIQAKFRRHHYFDQKGEHPRLTAVEKLMHFLPWQITALYAKDHQERLNAIVEENQYDLIFIFKLEPIFYFLRLPAQWRQRTVVDYDDFLSDIYRNCYKNVFTCFKNVYSLLLYQFKALIQFKRVFVCAPCALAQIPRMWRHKAGIIPNVFEARPDHFSVNPGQKDRLLFIGSLDYFPNTEGLKWFFRDIWPDFRRRYPEARLTVVGKFPESAGNREALFEQPEQVDIVINAPDILSYYQNCFAAVVPLLHGSGTRLKILESAAYGRPVLTTPKGMEGLDFADRKNIFVFKDARSFMDAYEALQDESCYRNAVQDAYGVLQGRYSLEAFMEAMDQNWGKIVD